MSFDIYNIMKSCHEDEGSQISQIFAKFFVKIFESIQKSYQDFIQAHYKDICDIIHQCKQANFICKHANYIKIFVVYHLNHMHIFAQSRTGTSSLQSFQRNVWYLSKNHIKIFVISLKNHRKIFAQPRTGTSSLQSLQRNVWYLS